MTRGTMRGDCPALADWTYRNCGGMAPLPQPVGVALPRFPQARDEDGVGAAPA